MSWTEYYDKHEGQPPKEPLASWLGKIESKGFAIDLGCGAGKDTLFLLAHGFSVLAIDREEEALDRIKKQIKSKDLENLTLKRTAFENISLPKCDLINASFSLPFCEKSSFENLVKTITSSIRINGHFSGHFFGLEDEWVKKNKVSGANEMQIMDYFKDFKMLHFKELKWEGPTATRPKKNWHVYEVFSKKIK